ncbi:MAG: SAM-dependent DNA methyltransferase [Desulfovibrionaceae bacterium]|nr:SAM-dependent DNA methyltransferase [Desulfovibrionaceae bacterium]
MAKPKTKKNKNSANLGFEAQMWQAADALRGSMDAAEYKHVVLGLIFLKYISDAFEEQHAKLEAERAQGADPEDQDEYRAQNIFWVPPEARWSYLKSAAKQPTIGRIVDDAMAGIERDNPSLKGVLPKDYARPALDKQRLGQLIDLVSNIRIGDAESRAKDVLGRVYEYFLSRFASAEGKKGGEFYTPRCVVKILVEMLEPYKGRVYDPCCGSSGMFVQSIDFINAHINAPPVFRPAGHGINPKGKNNMFEGLWTILFNVQGRLASLTVTIHGDTLTGGNSEYYYIGKGNINGDQMNGDLVARHYAGSPDPLFNNALEIPLRFTAKVEGDSMHGVAKTAGWEIPLEGIKRT